MNVAQFIKICKFNQTNLKKYVFKKLRKTHEDIVWEDGFVYAKGTFPVLLVAHLDTVHRENVKTVVYDKANGRISSPQGIGGDDRCGVYMILEIAKRYNCSVLFCEDEEIGGHGAQKFVDSPNALHMDVKYIIELDRKGSTDAVFYSCDNPDFTNFICKDYFKESYGTFSDISIIAPMLGIAAVNLSSGYYEAHTKSEYVIETDVDNVLDGVYSILARTDDTTFEYIEKQYQYQYGKYRDWEYRDYYEYLGESTSNKTETKHKDDLEAYEIEFVDCHMATDYIIVWAESEDDAILQFLVGNPMIPYGNLISITNHGDLTGGWG